MKRRRNHYPQTCAVHAPGDLSCAASCPHVLHPAPPPPEGPPESERAFWRQRVELAIDETVGHKLTHEEHGALAMRLWSELNIAPDLEVDVRTPDGLSDDRTSELDDAAALERGELAEVKS